jgi:hypothetical protein
MLSGIGISMDTDAEFLDEIQTKVFRVFFLAIFTVTPTALP